jgi:hypothetical protein
MMFAALLLLATGWFGPATVDEALPTTGNPFSPTENDVRCEFTQGGRHFERFAYFAHGMWHATLSSDKGGAYDAHFTLNGKPIGETEHMTLAPSADGDFVRLNGVRFKLSSGKPYVPFGHDFGWQNGADATYPKQLADMHDAGLNWTRIWADPWDDKNPFYPADREPKPQLGYMIESALDRWDMIVHVCEKDDVKFQFVLFHHGLFSTTTDSNWAQNPWNTKNGGFLSDPTDFFVDPEAKTLSKAWFRYAVARWGDSPSIMAWELFNEVQWVDAIKLHPERIPDVIAWHKEMGDYVRSIDPYHHLVTSSSSESLDPRVFATMDYLQPHTYPPSIYGALLGTPPPNTRPMFYGELGPGGGRAGNDKLAVRDGFWGGLLGAHSGPGQYWFWDRVYRSNLYPEFARDSKFLELSGFAEHPSAKPATIEVTGGVPSDLVLHPGRGWAATDKFTYDLPRDAATGSLPLLSAYVQGAKNANRATMMKEPLRFWFVAKSAGEAHIRVSQVSKGGGAFNVSINGAATAVYSKEWPATPRDTRVREDIVVPFSAG